MPTLVEIPKNPAAIIMGSVPDNGEPPWEYTLVDHYPDTIMTQKDRPRGHRMQALWFEYTRAATSRNASDLPELHGPNCAVHKAIPNGVTVPDSLPDCDGKDCLSFQNPGNFSEMSWPSSEPDPTCHDTNCLNNTASATTYCAKCLPEAEEQGFACRNTKCAVNTDAERNTYCPHHHDSLIENGLLCNLCDFMRTDLRDRCQCPTDTEPQEPTSGSKYLLPVEDWLEPDTEAPSG